MRKSIVACLTITPLLALAACGDDSGVGGSGGESTAGPTTHASTSTSGTGTTGTTTSTTTTATTTTTTSSGSTAASTAASTSSGGPVCGNNIVEAGEECDDGNTTDGDSCEGDCTTPSCGNGIVDAGEECDDGNTVDGDTCESDCAAATCGNNITDTGEMCDDGNNTNGDGCEANCTSPTCGNNIIDAGEACDDGNTTNGDTCEGNCTLPACGNNIVDVGEACDDGNAVNGDGCDTNCTVSACGNGICSGGEDSCSCAADCPDDPNTCSSCECGSFAIPGQACNCDAICTEFGDCCGNETAQCGVQNTSFTFSATPATPVTIPDNAYVGTIGSMGCMPVHTVAIGQMVSVNFVTVGMTHTWIGDLTVKLVSPTGTVVTLMSRPSMTEVGDNGSDVGSGDSSNLLAANPITFTNAATVTAENMGNTIGDNNTVCAPAPGGDGICNFIPDIGSAAPGTLGASYAGQVPTGDWQLCVGDSALIDTGTISTVSINVTISG